MNNPPDVAFFLPSLRGGGAERVMLNLAIAFSSLGYTVDLVLAENEGPYLKYVPDDIRLVIFENKHVSESRPQLVNYLRSTKPNVLLSTIDTANVVAIEAVTIAGVSTRHVARVSNTPSMKFREYERNGKHQLTRHIRASYPQAEKIIAVSNGVADDLVTAVNCDRDRITVIYNPIKPSEILAQAATRVDEWTDTDVPTILGAGRLVNQKDFPTLIHAFDRILNERQARLIILGDGERKRALQTLIHSLGLADHITLAGFVENPFFYMHGSDVFVLSSAWEGFPNVLIEAMVCGTPIVSTNCPNGPAEILDCGRYGSLVQVGRPAALADAILSALDEPIDPETLRSRAMQFSMDCIVRLPRFSRPSAEIRPVERC